MNGPRDPLATASNEAHLTYGGIKFRTKAPREIFQAEDAVALTGIPYQLDMKEPAHEVKLAWKYQTDLRKFSVKRIRIY